MMKFRDNLVAIFAVLMLVFACASPAFADPNALPTAPQALDAAGFDRLRATRPDLNGNHTNVGMLCRSYTYTDGIPQNDYLPSLHNCLQDANITPYDAATSTAGASPHSTALCGILFGRDPNAQVPDLGNFHYQGVVPNANAHVFEFWYFLTEYVFPCQKPNVDILTTSIGSPFNDWWTRGLDALAQKHGLPIIASIGNGRDAHDPALLPAASHNAIGVGVLSGVNSDDPLVFLANFALAYPEFSSFGPTADGRCKPDLVAPGNCIAPRHDFNDIYEISGDFSSFATPIVAGAADLLVQEIKQNDSLNVEQKNTGILIRSILMNAAKKLPYWHKGELGLEDDHEKPLDFLQGAGMIDAAKAIAQLSAGQKQPGLVETSGWDLNEVTKEIPQVTYEFTVDSNAPQELTVTLVWNRHFKQQYPFESIQEKDSNLRLELWGIDLENPDNDKQLDYSDSTLDNVEHLYLSLDPNYTTFQIVVAIDTQDDSDHKETYAVAWNLEKSSDSEKRDILWYDLNADGVVDAEDMTVFMNNIAQVDENPSDYLIGDINANGKIEADDLDEILARFEDTADWYLP